MAGSWNVTAVPDDPDNGHISANDAVDELVRGVSQPLAVDLSSGNETLTADEFAFNLAFVASGHSITRTLTIPSSIEKEFLVINSGTGIVTVTHGSTTIDVAAGAVRRFFTDGTTDDLIALTGNVAPTGNPDGNTIYDFGFTFEDTPSASAIIGRVAIGRAVTIPADFAGIGGDGDTNPDAQFDIDVQDDGASIGTITISAAGAISGSTSGGTSKDVAAGSVITFQAPAGSPAEGSIAGWAVVVPARITP